MYMRLQGGKAKAFTMSYDDAVVQDIRLVALMDKYGVKGTFNINSGRYWPEDKQRERFYGRMKRSEAVQLFQNSGHEVAIHGYTHADLSQLSGQDTLREVWDDREAAEKDYGQLIRGMAYAYGTYREESLEALKLCGLGYSRTTASTSKFRFPENWLTWHPTCHHKNPRQMELTENFVKAKIGSSSGASLFCLWGHSYEFDDDNNWELIEALLEKIGGREDIWYATNGEIYDYVQAYQSLIVSLDGNTVKNPTATDVWFSDGAQTYCVPAGGIWQR